MGGPARLMTKTLDAATWIVLALVVWFVVKGRQAPVPPAASIASAYLSQDSLLADLPIVDVDGKATSLDLATSNSKALLLVFRSDCHVCATQKAGWEALSEAAYRSNVAVIALTSEQMTPAVAGYFRQDRIKTFSLIRPEDIMSGLGTSMVPTTIVVTGRRVSLHRIGLLGEDQLDDVSVEITDATRM